MALLDRIRYPYLVAAIAGGAVLLNVIFSVLVLLRVYAVAPEGRDATYAAAMPFLYTTVALTIGFLVLLIASCMAAWRQKGLPPSE